MFLDTANLAKLKKLCSDTAKSNKAKVRDFKKRKDPICNYLLSFDIETTNWDEVNATMYDWTLGGADYETLITCKNNDDLKENVTCVFGRTWEDFDMACQLLSDCAESSGRRVLVLVYNLGYEWSFMQRNTNFVRDNYIEDYPTVIEGMHNIMAVCAGGLIFVDAARVFGLGSLKQNAGKYGFKKLEYDYDVKRHSKTELTQEEIEYNENDVLITLGAWAMCQYNNNYKFVNDMPLTSTGVIRDSLKRNEYVNAVRDYHIDAHKNRAKNPKTKWRHQKVNDRLFDEAVEIADHVFPDDMEREDVAALLEAAFSGGYTHCNIYSQGNVYYNVASMDLGSAYPGAMMAAWFPKQLETVKDPNSTLTRFMKVLHRTFPDSLSLAKGTRDSLPCFGVATVILKDVRVKPQTGGFNLPLISRHKLQAATTDALFDNGKLVECSECKITCSTIDLITWGFCYNYTIINCEQMLIGRNIGQLPDYWRNAVEYCYTGKTVLKNTLKKFKSGGDWQTEYRKLPDTNDTEIKHVESMETHEAEYYLDMVLHQHKSRLNGLYGIMVMHIIRENYTYNNEKDIIKGENTVRKAKDGTCYLWGIIVTSIVRLWEVTSSIYMGEHGCTCHYWDTDSVKLSFPENVDITALITDFNNYTGAVLPKYPALGAYDYEGTYAAFKSLGSKRYVVCERNKEGKFEFEATIAGLPKRVYSEFLTQEYNYAVPFIGHFKAVERAMEYFCPNIYIDESATSKLVPMYVTTPIETTLELEDYKGQKITQTFWPGARLSGIQFAIMSLESKENRVYQALCDKTQGRIADEYINRVVTYENGHYFIKDGSLNVPDLVAYSSGRDVKVLY